MEHRILELNQNSSRYLQVHKNTIRYTGKGARSNDVGAIRSSTPIPNDELVYYFEIYIEEAGPKATIGIGLSTSDFSLNKYPGFDINSYGYIGEDGKKAYDQGKAQDYGPTFTVGDYVGCGFHFANQEIFYTLNGKHLGIAFQKVSNNVQYFPTIGLHSPDEKVTVNFGNFPFEFNLNEYLEEERKKFIDSILQTPFDVSQMIDLIKQYLLYNGFEDTFKSLTQNCIDDSSNNEHELKTLSVRKAIRTFVLKGDIESAIRYTREVFPDLFEPSNSKASRVLFFCKCQQFIECIRSGETQKSLEFMQTNLSHYFRVSNAIDKDFLESVVALLAYSDPKTSPVAYLLAEAQRTVVADALNQVILSYKQPETVENSSKLEILLRQLILTKEISKDENFLSDSTTILDFDVPDIQSILFPRIDQ